MKVPDHTCSCRLRIDDPYLSHPTDSPRPAQSGLWGISDKRPEAIIHQESGGADSHHFRPWHRLSGDFRYGGPAASPNSRVNTEALTGAARNFLPSGSTFSFNPAVL